ncbi:hypothetical protein Tco_0620913 [Tanacetum coccineum]
MSTSNTHQKSLVDSGSETRPLMLERGSYIPLASHFRRYLNQKRENRKWLNKAIDEGPYVFKDFTPPDSQSPRLQTEEDLKHYEAEIEFDQFVVEPGEALVPVYDRISQLMNDLERNGIKFPQSLSRQKDTHDDLFDYLHQYEKLVNASRVKKLEKSHDPLALVAHTGSSSRTLSPYYVTNPSSVDDYDDDYQGGAFQNNSEYPPTSAMIEKGHYSRNCPKLKVRDSKYFMEQMLLAKQDEAGVTLNDEHNDFIVADVTQRE